MLGPCRRKEAHRSHGVILVYIGLLLGTISQGPGDEAHTKRVVPHWTREDSQQVSVSFHRAAWTLGDNAFAPIWDGLAKTLPASQNVYASSSISSGPPSPNSEAREDSCQP